MHRAGRPGNIYSSTNPMVPTTKPVRQPDVDEKTRHAPMYRVLIHNDDVTPMDFVVAVLRSIFHKDVNSAMQIMLEAHHGNVALVAVLSLEEAEFRVDKAHAVARTAKFPLTFTYEPE